MNNFEEYDLRHWENDEFDELTIYTARNGVFSLTPEIIYSLLTRYSPVGYREGEIMLDVPVESFLKFWEDLGGEYARR